MAKENKRGSSPSLLDSIIDFFKTIGQSLSRFFSAVRNFFRKIIQAPEAKRPSPSTQEPKQSHLHTDTPTSPITPGSVITPPNPSTPVRESLPVGEQTIESSEALLPTPAQSIEKKPPESDQTSFVQESETRTQIAEGIPESPVLSPSTPPILNRSISSTELPINELAEKAASISEEMERDFEIQLQPRRANWQIQLSHINLGDTMQKVYMETLTEAHIILWKSNIEKSEDPTFKEIQTKINEIETLLKSPNTAENLQHKLFELTANLDTDLTKVKKQKSNVMNSPKG